MKYSIIKAFVVLSVVLGASSVWASVVQAQDEINRSFTLSAKARVEVSAISGNIDIKAVDGDTAMVHIERTVRRGNLDCNKVVLEQAAGNLIVQSKTVRGPGCENVQVDYRVLLSIPRHVDVSVHGNSGPINIGETDGTLRISGNSGDIDVERLGNGSRITGNSGDINVKQLSSGSRITGNSGATNINLRRFDGGGVDVSGNSGAVNLYVGDELNIEVKVSGLSGSVSSELPNVQFTKTGAADYYARIGSGGATINVHGSSGSILLGRYRE